MKRLSLALISFLFCSTKIFAQDVSITAEVDKNVVSLDDQVTLTISVSGPTANPPDPELPSMPNFTIYSSGRSQNISIVNGQMSGSVTYNYALTPRFPGKVTIAPISITLQGKKYQTAPIEIQVVRPGSAPAQAPPRNPPGSPPQTAPSASNPQAGGPDVYVVASLDKKKAFVNEQVTLTIRFFSSVPLLGNAQYAPPELQGFLTEDMPPERHGQGQSHGRTYNYSEIKTALFPAQSGRLTIGPAAIRCQVASANGVDPFAQDFFQRFFAQGMGGQTKELRTDRLSLQVEPLPESRKPDSFTGAVGQFRVSATVDKRSVNVGDAVNLTLTIEGSGNLKALGSPKLPDMPSFRVYDTVSSLNLSKDRDIVHGSKVFRTVLVPRVSGPLKIPSIPFSYFDPAAGNYVQSGTAAIDLQVNPGAAGSSGTSYVSQTPQNSDLTTVSEDIRYIKESIHESALSLLLAGLSRRIWIHLLPLIAFILALGRKLYLDRLLMDPAGVRFRTAWANARTRLTEAKNQISANAPGHAAALLWEGLEDFLSDKLNHPIAGMTLKQVLETLTKAFPKVSEQSVSSLKSLWEELELLRFAGENAVTPAAVASLLPQAEETLRKLDQEMRK